MAISRRCNKTERFNVNSVNCMKAPWNLKPNKTHVWDLLQCTCKSLQIKKTASTILNHSTWSTVTLKRCNLYTYVRSYCTSTCASHLLFVCSESYSTVKQRSLESITLLNWRKRLQSTRVPLFIRSIFYLQHIKDTRSTYLYEKELILCHLAHSQTPLQSLSTSSTGPGHHCMLRHVLGKPGLKKHNGKYKITYMYYKKGDVYPWLDRTYS